MKFVCPVCGYVEDFDGDELPADYVCPQCKCPGSRFTKQDGDLTWAANLLSVVGIGKAEGVSEDIVEDLRANFNGECSEVGMYLAMSRRRLSRAIPRSASTTKRPPTRRLSTPPSSLSFSARS